MEMKNKCVRCGRDQTMMVMMSPAKVTESGRINYPNENKDMSLQLPIELCFYCMQLASEDFISLLEENKKFNIIELADKNSEFSVEFFEDRAKKGELKKDILESLEKLKTTRAKVKKQRKKKAPLRIAIIIDEALDSYAKFKDKTEPVEVQKR